MSRRSLLFAALLAWAFLPATAQVNVDSLKALYEHEQDDSVRIRLGCILAAETGRNDPLYAIETSKFILDRLDKSLSISDAWRSRIRMAIFHNLSNAYLSVGDNQKSIDALLEALRIAQKSGNRASEMGLLNNLGAVFDSQGMKEEAMGYTRRSLQMAAEDSNTYSLALALGGIGSFFESQPDSSILYYRRSLEVMTRPDMKDREGAMGWMTNNIGDWHEKQGNTDSALYYYLRSLAIRESIDHRQGQFIVHGDLARLYAETNQPARALHHIDESIRIGEANNFVSDLFKSYKLRSELRAAKGDYHGALEDHRRYLSLRDSAENEKDAKAIIQQTMRYEYGRKHLADSLTYEAGKAIQEKEIQRQRTMRNGFMGGFALVALFAAVFFTQRNRIAKEKARSEELLLNILPEEVAGELKEKGASDARLIDEVTVLFSDFKGFTTLAESMSAHDLVKDLNTFFSAFDRMCQKHGIEKIKTIGDAYMAAGGLPVPNQTHATDVVRLALDIQAFMQEQVEKRKKDNLPVFEIRIGIHTGPVVAGIVGVKKFAYDIWGDTVNTAARMEQHSEPGRINISGSTYARVKDALTCTHRGKIDAKNKGEIDMYFVENPILPQAGPSGATDA